MMAKWLFKSLMMVLWFTVAGGIPADAQEDESAQQKIVVGIEKLEACDTVVFAGSIGNSEAAEDGEVGDEESEKGPRITFANGGSGDTFDGAFEVVQDRQRNELLICSKDRLPGIEIYDDGEDVYLSATYRADAIFTTGDLVGDLRQLLTYENLKKYTKRSEDVTSETQGGSTVYEVVLSNRVIRPTGGLETPATIEKVKVVFSIDENSEIRSMDFHVTRDNPLVALLEGNSAISDPAMRENVLRQVPKSINAVYQLRRQTEMSERSSQVLESMRSLPKE